MILQDPVKDFFVKAVMHAKHDRMKLLNELEAEIIIAEELFLVLQKGLSTTKQAVFENKIYNLKRIINNKKDEL